MNNIILLAALVRDPELRYTPDTETPTAEFWVQVDGLRDDDPPALLKVTGWGNLAQEIQERYRLGDQVIIEGWLQMLTVERSEGFKEKVAELTAQKIHAVTATASPIPTSAPPAAPVPPAAKTKANRSQGKNKAGRNKAKVGLQDTAPGEADD